MKFSLIVGEDLHFEVYKYDQPTYFTSLNARIWVIKQYPGDPETATPLILQLRDASTDAITRHLIAESGGYYPHAETVDFRWTLHSGLDHSRLSLIGQEFGVVTQRLHNSRLRLEDRLRAIFDMMNATENFLFDETRCR